MRWCGTWRMDPYSGEEIPGPRCCLAHMEKAEREEFLRQLGPGAEVDFRGVSFTPNCS